MNLPNHDKSGRSLYFSKGLVYSRELLHLQNRLKHLLNGAVREIVLKKVVADAVILQSAGDVRGPFLWSGDFFRFRDRQAQAGRRGRRTGGERFH